MRIIDNTPHKSVVKECVCYNCGVTLEYVPNDVSKRTETDYTGSKDIISYVVCPACNHQVTVRGY